MKRIQPSTAVVQKKRNLMVIAKESRGREKWSPGRHGDQNLRRITKSRDRGNLWVTIDSECEKREKRVFPAADSHAMQSALKIHAKCC
jgi:hypothetical protein